MMLKDLQIINKGDKKTIYRSGDDVIKVFDPSHPKSAVFNEAHIHAAAEDAGLPVPTLKSVECFEGGWGLVMSHSEGKTLAQIMEEDPKNYKKYLDQLIDIQLEVNKFSAPRLRNTIDKMAEKVNELKEEIDPSTRYELQQRLRGMRRHTKMCHGDLIPSNVIIQENGYKVIDWSHATQGNAGADAALTYLHFCLTNKDYAEYYLDSYCLKADLPKQYIQKWMPIIAAYKLGRVKPEDEKLLREWIAVAEYM
ncbi:MAG: aminoglycoside phosphotransferase family protein [Lachnospiraceae bacterium]|nr:aminoglycoside phosphotransferase family protein [Lachnospiraceae bacterium]